jgi:hypothetical protein
MVDSEKQPFARRRDAAPHGGRFGRSSRQQAPQPWQHPAGRYGDDAVPRVLTDRCLAVAW